MYTVIFICAFIVTLASYVMHTYTHYLEHKGQTVPAFVNKYFHSIVHAGYYAWLIMLFFDPIRFDRHLYLIVIGAAIGTIGLYLMMRARKERKASVGNVLITTGLYSVFRNPMYAGMALMYLFYPLATGSTTTLLSAVIWILQMTIWTYWENKELSVKFGQSYQDYKQKVKLPF